MGHIDADYGRMIQGGLEKSRKIRFRQPRLIGQGTERSRQPQVAVGQGSRQELQTQKKRRLDRPDPVPMTPVESDGIDGPPTSKTAIARDGTSGNTCQIAPVSGCIMAMPDKKRRLSAQWKLPDGYVLLGK